MASIDSNDSPCHDFSDYNNMPISTIMNEPSPPSDELQQIGDKKQYIIYSRGDANVFHTWWETTV